MRISTSILSKKYLSQSHQDDFLDRRNRQSVTQFVQNKMSICTISSPRPTPAQFSMEPALENLTKASQD
jgi:hypothetical protein